MEKEGKPKKAFWQPPWAYKHGFLFAGGLLLCGLLLDMVSSSGPAIPPWPLNMALAVVILFFLFFLFRLSMDTPWLRFFYSVPASVGAIALFSVLSLAIGLVPWEGEGMNTARLLSSWSYLIAHMYVLLTLGLTLFHRLRRIRKKDLAFVFNHAGLWIVLAAAGLGASDIQKRYMTVEEGQTVWYAKDENGKTVELPLAIKLHDFILEEYQPKVILVTEADGYLAEVAGNPAMPDDSLPSRIQIGDFQIDVLEFVAEGFYTDSALYPLKRIGSAPYFRVEVRKSEASTVRTDWISTGSRLLPQRWLRLDGGYALAMMPAEPLRYLSRITLYREGFDPIDAEIEVNKPLHIDGWKIYQMSYDEEMGKYSTWSVFELVKDPWLKVVYIGFFLMIAGAVLLFWQGKHRKVQKDGK